MTANDMDQARESAAAIFDAALDLPESQRAAFVERVCAGDELLRKRAEALIQAHESAGAFMESPPPVPIPGVAHLGLDQSDQRIGPYKILQEIGEGGCGVVYMAEQEIPIRRRVALKIIKLGMDTRQVIARFEAERQALALMDHPNIARVLDAGATDSGRPFFVMELVAGEKITDYCDRRQLRTSLRLGLFVQVCRAVQHAHQKGIIHRDLKPSNVLVTELDGQPVPKVIDFGIAKATGDVRLTDRTLFTAFEQFIGTPAYMSPEQVGLGRLDIDTRSDIYSLGALLYELLTGHPPFDNDALKSTPLDQVLQTIREKDPPRPSTRLTGLTQPQFIAVAECRRAEPPKLLQMVRGDLDWIVMKALEKDRTRRYETVSGLARDVERHLAKETVLARPNSAAYRLQRWVSRHKLLFASGTAIAAALVLGIVASTAEALRARRAEQHANAAAGETKAALACLDLLEANRLTEANNGPEAIPFLVRILSADPENSAALTRLAILLTYRQWLIPAVTVGHDNWVDCAEFSPDGSLIVTASSDNSARVWDARTGMPVTEPLRHTSLVYPARFSPDGNLVVTASWDGTARVWEARTGRPLTGPLQHEGEVFDAEFSPDGERLVTASADNTARVWDARTGRSLAQALKHQSFVKCAQFSPDGKRIATGSNDRTSRVWDAQTGLALTEPLSHGAAVNCVQFSPDGARLLTGSEDGTAWVWDAQTGRHQTGPFEHNAGVRSARFSPDGRQVATSSMDKTARLWDSQTGRPLTQPLQHMSGVSVAEFSPNGQRVVTGANDWTARLWDAHTGQLLAEPMRHNALVTGAKFSPDGLRILTASADTTARVWEPATSPARSLPLSHQGWVASAQFSPDGTRIVTASTDHTARIWNASTGLLVTKPLQHADVVVSAEFSPDGKLVVTASRDQTARVWDAFTGEPVTEPLRHKALVVSAQFNPEGNRIVTASFDHTAHLWDAQTGRPLGAPLTHRDRLNCARFSPDGACILTGSADHTARVWEAKTGRLIAEMRHESDVNTARFSPDGRRVVTASGDNTARVWDPQTGRAIGKPFRHLDYVLDASFSPDGRRIVTACRDNRARVWDVAAGQTVTVPFEHEQSVDFAEFSPDGKQVLTASSDGTARLWDVATGQPLCEPLRHSLKLFAAHFSPDGSRVVTASGDNTAQVWDVNMVPGSSPEWLGHLAEALSGTRLNKRGTLEPTTLDRVQTVAQIRDYLKSQPDDGNGVRWGRWLLADPATRAISPFASLSVPHYIENQKRRSN